MSAVLLYEVVCLIWVSMIFLSAIKDYNGIIAAFAAGSFISVAGAAGLGRVAGLAGYTFGYLLGQAFIFFWLTARLLTEFPASPPWNSDVISYFRKFWDLMLIGLIYNLAIWADKFVFWLAPDARIVAGPFLAHDLYEGPIFFAYLTVVPTLAIFLLKIETGFYEHYQKYYKKIIGKRTFESIVQEKELMIHMLKGSMREVFIVQGGVSTLCLLYARELGVMAGLSPIQVPILRASLIGALLQVLLSLVLIILFYFDLRRRVLACVTVFLALNTGLAWLSIRLGVQYYGFGYAYACLGSLLFSFAVLSRSIDDLEYITFARQPVL